MKRVISTIVSVLLTCNIFVSFQAASASARVDLPAYDCELGFIFMTDGVQFNNTNPDDYEGVEVVFNELHMYFAPSLGVLTDISVKFNVTSWEENRLLDIPEEPEISLEDVVYDTVNTFSLFSEETSDETSDVDDAVTDEPYVNDPWFEWQWYYEAVHAQAYRDNGIDGTGVTVAICDSGFNTGLDDFDYDNITIVSDKEGISNTIDYYDHGVPVTSIIAAQANNNIGIAGMTDKVKVLEYKATGDITCLDIFTACVYAYEDGANVINISAGGNYYSKNEEKFYAYLAERGVIIIAAAGNDGRESEDANQNILIYPAAYADVIGVGAVHPTYKMQSIWYDKTTMKIGDKADISRENLAASGIWTLSDIRNNPANAYMKADFSTANESVYISAPGYVMAMYGNDNMMSNNLGTSFATPIVTSAAIGVKQMRPYVDSEMFKEILRETAVDLDEEGYDINTGYGMVDFQAIYDYVSQMPETMPEKTPNITINYTDETLDGFFYHSTYLVNGEEIYVDKTDYVLPIKDEWYGTDISIQKLAGKSCTDSEVQILTIPAVPAAHADFNVGYNSSGDWVYITADNPIEYKAPDSEKWNKYYYGIPTGTYDIRYAATENTFASESKRITFFKTPEPQIEIDYTNKQLVVDNYSDDYVYYVKGEEYSGISERFDIPESWHGKNIGIYAKHRDEYAGESVWTYTNIPRVPDKPNIRYEIIFDEDGSVSRIDGITEEMEFRRVGMNEWETGEITDYGKYEIRYKATDNSFAGISYVVTFNDREYTGEYDIETSVSYNEGTVYYSYNNHTGKDIAATGVIAVYNGDNFLVRVEILTTLKNGQNSAFFAAEGDVSCVKFFIWNSLGNMKPYDKAEMSVWEV